MKGYGKREPGKYGFGNGLELHVRKTGVSAWKLRERVNGKDTSVVLGHADAHHNERWARREIEKRLEGQAVNLASLETALKDWAENKLISQRWSQRHYDKTLERLAKNCAPFWQTDIAKLDRPFIVDQLEKVSCIDTAGRCYTWIRECLETEVDRGNLPYNVLSRKPETLTIPAHQVKRHKSFDADYAKLKELLRAIRLSDRTRSVRLAGQMAILSGLRLGEVNILHTDYVKHDRIVIPRKMMKEKGRWRGDYQLPTPGALGELVQSAVESSINGWLFPGPRSRKPISHEGVEKMYRELTNREAVPHGSRRSIRTYAIETLMVGERVANGLIDHATEKDTEARYDASQFFDQRRDVLAKWCEMLTDGQNFTQ